MKTAAAPQKSPDHGTPDRKPAERAVQPIQRMQRAVGNYAFQQLVQMKLQVGAPTDPLEREADRVAEQVLAPGACGGCSSGHPCAKCEEPQTIQRKEASPHPAADAGGGDVHARIEALQGGGQHLPAPVRTFFEGRFGADFAPVRVHTGPRANELTSAVQARAFTFGRNVVFGAGEYAPETGEGKRLLAHELTHVVQQGGGAKGAEPVIRRKTKVQSAIDDADIAQVEALHHSALQLATPDQKIALIRLILEKGGPTYRLDLLWQGVSDAVVEANIDLWTSTWAQHAGSMSNHPRKSQFNRDVEDVANAMLTESEAACEGYLQFYGLTPDSVKPGENTAERDQSVNAVQRTAIDVMGAQTQLKRLWAVMIPTDPKYLGYGSSMKGSYPFELDNPPMYASPEGMELWTKTGAVVRELTTAIDDYLEAFPELYPLVMGGKSSKRDAYTDVSRTSLAATKPVDAIEQGLRETLENIRSSRSSIRVLARDGKLGPVAQQLLSGARSVGGRNWKTGPVWSAMVPAITAKAGVGTMLLEGALMLAVQIALAVSTGGFGNLLLSAAQATLSYAEASVLQTASDTSLTAKNALVSKQDVASAKLTAAIDAAFLIFDIIPGVKQMRGAWSAARGSGHLVQQAAAELEKKVLLFESKMMQKAEKAELDALRKSMEQEADAARKSLQETKAAAADAPEAEKVLAQAEVRKAEEALARVDNALQATKAIEAGDILVVEMGGRRYSWVPGRGLVICASPCAKAVHWIEDRGRVLADEATAHSPLAGTAFEKRLSSAKAHMASIDAKLNTTTLTPAEFERATAHADSIIAELEGQHRFSLMRYPATGAKDTLDNVKWAEGLMQELQRRRQAIEAVDTKFYGSLGPDVEAKAAGAHGSEWESKIGKFRDPAKPKERLGSLTQRLEEESKSTVVDANKRAKIMDDIDVALTNYERELRGQRELVLSGGELKAFTDEQAGKLLYPNMTAAELKAAKKPDYIAETADRLIIGDSKGGGSVDTSIRQIEPALSSDYVKDAIAAGKKIECRVYLDAEEAARLKLVGRGHPPVLHKIGEDGKEIAYGVGGLPLYVVFN